MAGPRDFLKKAENNRRMELRKPPVPLQPAPMQIPAKQDFLTPQTPEKNKPLPDAPHQEPMNADAPPEYRIAPRPIGGHGIYRELMRSHDRMGTRHIPRKD